MTKLQEDDETESRPSSRNSFFVRIKKDDRSKLSVRSKVSSKASTAVKSPRKPENAIVNEEQAKQDQDKEESAGSRVDSNVHIGGT